MTLSMFIEHNIPFFEESSFCPNFIMLVAKFGVFLQLELHNTTLNTYFSKKI